MAPSSTTTSTVSSEMEQTSPFPGERKDDGGNSNTKGERKGVINRAMPREEIKARETTNQGKKMDRIGKRKMTVLEQHCSFFDVNADGILYPHETYQTCRSFDWSIPLSLFFAVFLHAIQSWATVPWWHGLPDPFLRIWVHNVHFNKHGSSTMAFDSEGVFRPEVLDAFFTKFDEDGKDGLTFWEGWRGLRRIRMAWDAFGQASAMFEWGFAYLFLWPEDGVVRRKDAHRILDGSIFHEKVMQKRKGDEQRVSANAFKSI